MLKKWQLKDVILLAFLSIFFGGVFVGSGYLFDILTLILAPLGLQAFANEILFGLWCMAAPIAPSLFQESEVQRLEKCSLRLLKSFMVANSV